ncbi:MAG: L,D-transpeptidase [Bacteroidetes bacterium]|nr:L,D-transpeptidase [Bacteroidota bacterium]
MIEIVIAPIIKFRHFISKLFRLCFAAQQELSAGGEIKIHGFPNHHRKNQEKDFKFDWTLGCIAVSDFEVDELYRWVKHLCPI